ncbi:MAG TPA: hypothetical protein VK969_06320 [Acidimicrobiia bacterium]|nr:hypothetical protein [Acidimicrobiia bacterium]
MTATIKPPDRGTGSRRRPLRFTSLESLGFSDDESVWSDSPADVPTEEIEAWESETSPQGRHETPPPEPDPFADWAPQEVGRGLTSGNTRWSTIVIGVLVVTALAAVGYWLYQRPEVQEQASIETVSTQARALHSALPALEAFNGTLLEDTPDADTGALDAVEREARALFEASGTLAGSNTELRTAASQAASSALDGARLVGAARSYRAAVVPAIAAPALETDPDLIALDEAARSFGSWQLGFDQARTALPESVLTEVTQGLDVVSGDLPSIMGRYVDALREDDQSAAEAVLLDLSSRLSQVRTTLDESLEGIQGRVNVRIEQSTAALDRLIGD